MTQPTDEEIRELWSQYNPLHGIQSFARAVLAKWGAPQQVAQEPVGIDFGMSGAQMYFKIGNQLFKLAYEPEDNEEFEFMMRMLMNAFSVFTPDVKAAPQQAAPAGWIDTNDKTQEQYLPHIGEQVLFCHGGKTYWGKHTGGGFVTGNGVVQKYFSTWECRWQYPPVAHGIKGGQHGAE